jgi:lysophospholipase L1-like esterase
MRRHRKIALAAAGLAAGLALLELGLRGAARLAAPPAPPSRPPGGPRVVLCLGESTTAPSWGVDHSWPLQLGRILNEGRGEGSFLVVNKGIPATNSGAVAAALPGWLEQYKPDVVVAMLGANDPRWFGLAENDGSADLSRLKVAKVLRYFYYEVLRRPFTGGSEADSVRHRRSIARLLRARGVPLIAMQYPTLDVTPLKAVYEGEPGVLFVENKDAFARALAKERYEDFFIDTFGETWGHASARGDRMIAESAAEGVARALKLPEKAPPPAPEAGSRARLRAALEARPDDIDTLRRLLALLRGDKKASLALVDRAAGRAPGVQFFHEAGRVHLELGDRAGGIWWLERALALDSSVPGPLRMVIDAHRDEPAKAAAYADKAVRAARESRPQRLPEAELEVARTRWWLGKLPEARAALERALAARVDDPESLRLVPDLLCGEPARGLAHAERAEKAVETGFAYHRARVYREAAGIRDACGDAAGAKALRERAQRVAPL